MIQATELRIGNLIQLIYQSKRPSLEERIVRVDRIDEIGVEILENGERVFGASYELLEPIPLTEEILLKCGFEKLQNNWKRFCICEDWTYIYWERLSGLELSVNNRSVMLPHIKHLHQLQNLIYDLSINKDELNITYSNDFN